MKTILVLLWIQVIAVTLEYEFRCPVAGEWRLRPRKLFCGATQYVCLLYLPDKTYHETCDGTDFSSPGSKLVFQPNFNKATCSYDRYQPFPFSTDGSSACVYKKSFCNAEGQIIFNKGNFENDTRCGCNVSKGYIFVTNPINRCYCTPMQEDCACYKPVCKTKDIICPLDVGSITNSSCLVLPDNENIAPSTEDGLNTRTYVMDNNDRGSKNRLHCIYFMVAALVMITVIVSGWFADQLTITMQMKGEKVAVDYGTSITLSCNVIVRCKWCKWCVKSIDWYRNGQKIECDSSNTTKYKLDRKVPLIIIKDVDKNDLGNYQCVLETIFSRHTSENIKVVQDELESEVRFLRIFNLLFRVASPIVRMIFNDEINSTQLRKTLHKNRLQMKKQYRMKEKIINDSHWNLLFRSPGVISSEDFDIKLMIQLLRTLTHFDISDVYPAQADIRVGAVLSRINFIRNEITRNFDGKLTEYLFNEYWDEIGNAVLQLISFHTRDNQYSAERILSGRLFALNPFNIDNNKVRKFIDMTERYPAMILEQIISEYCKSQHQTREDVLKQETHNLYHKRLEFQCCTECESPNDWESDIPMITRSQWEALYEVDKGMKVNWDHRSVVPKKIIAMDFSIAKVLCLYIPSILTYIISRLYGEDLDTFLIDNKHLLYHYMEPRRCCQCKNDPTEKICINKKDWAKLFLKNDKKSHQEDKECCCCDYSLRKGLTNLNIDNDILVKIFLISGPFGILNKIEQDAFLNFLKWTVFDIPLQKALLELSNITDKDILSSDKNFATEIDARRWISKRVRNQKVITDKQFAILLQDEDGLNVKSIHIPNTFPLPPRARAFTDITAEENYFLVTVHVLTKIVHPVIKKMFDTTLTDQLSDELCMNWKNLHSERGKDDKEKGTHLTQQEYKYLSHKEQKGWKIDLKLMIDILIKTTKDKDIGGQLHVIDNFRTEIVQSSSGIVDEDHFQDIVKVISKAVTHLGGDIYQEKLRSLQIKRNILGNS